jgi:chromosome segregation ATPase
MPKQSDALDARRREVGNKDLEIVDAAINSHETLQRNLYTLRRILGEIGKLEEQYRGARQGVEAVQAEGARISSELEAAKTRLATVQHEESEKRKVVAELAAETAQKEQELRAYSEAIERIVGKAA